MTTPDASPRRSPLHSHHTSAGAVFAVEDGWEMPRDYGDADAELARAKDRAAVMDLSHLGRIRIRGDGAVDLLDRLCTHDAARQEDDTARYTLLLDDNGLLQAHGVLTRLEKFWVLTVPPACRQGVLDHASALADDLGAKADDQTFKTGTIATVGPAAAEILDRILPKKVGQLARGEARIGSMFIARYIAARTGATALWSLEVTLPNTLLGKAWQYITAKAGANAIAPAGLACRARLAQEAGHAMWGRELSLKTDPVSAGLTRAVDLNHNFVGRAALEAKMREAR